MRSAANANLALARAVGENIEGGGDAGRFLERLPVENLDPDELLRHLLLAQKASPDRLRGFARRIQKALERGRPMLEKETAARDASRDAAPNENTSGAIFAVAGRVGNCASCGQRIRLTGGGDSTCPTCAAWRRWYSAHLAASAALREAVR